MTKAIFFDVDGTLVSHTNNTVPESTRRALDLLAQKGIQRIVATGRHTSELAILPVNNIDFDAYILLNGQLCLDSQGNILSENPITGEEKDCIIRLFTEKTIPLVLVEKDRMYINFINDHVKIAQKAISTPLPDLGTYMGNPIYLAVGYVESGNESLLTGQLPGCKVTRWNRFAVDIVTSSGGKTSGIQEYLRQRRIPREETMAFGDGENDIEMLRYVQTGVAMGNADDAVKKCASYVTDSVDDDGIMNALLELNILDRST